MPVAARPVPLLILVHQLLRAPAMADKRAGKAVDKEEKMEEVKEKSVDDIFRYDEEALTAQRKSKPWENESADSTEPH